MRNVPREVCFLILFRFNGADLVLIYQRYSGNGLTVISVLIHIQSSWKVEGHDCNNGVNADDRHWPSCLTQRWRHALALGGCIKRRLLPLRSPHTDMGRVRVGRQGLWLGQEAV
jgi:hypothetical protein